MAARRSGVPGRVEQLVVAQQSSSVGDQGFEQSHLNGPEGHALPRQVTCRRKGRSPRRRSARRSIRIRGRLRARFARTRASSSSGSNGFTM